MNLNFIKKKQILKRTAIRIMNTFYPTESIKSSKLKWSNLGLQNPEHYTCSEQKSFSKEEFKAIGLRDYQDLIVNDNELWKMIPGRKRVLEIGCGIGRITEFFIEKFEQIFGVDIAKTMIENAKKRILNPRYHFLETDGKTLPFPDKMFDLVFSHAVFHHMPSREIIEANFREVLRVLVPNGLFKVQLRSTPTSKLNWFYGVSFSRQQAEALAEKIGFDVIYNKELVHKTDKRYLYLLLRKPETLK